MQVNIETPETESNQGATESEGLVMTSSQKRFYASEQCATASRALQNMVDNPKYNTESDYFSGNTLGFVGRHLYYLSTHPTTNVEGYLSNLKLMTNVKLRK